MKNHIMTDDSVTNFTFSDLTFDLLRCYQVVYITVVRWLHFFVCVGSRDACKEMSATSLPTRSFPNTASVVVFCTQQREHGRNYRICAQHRHAECWWKWTATRPSPAVWGQLAFYGSAVCYIFCRSTVMYTLMFYVLIQVIWPLFKYKLRKWYIIITSDLKQAHLDIVLLLCYA